MTDATPDALTHFGGFKPPHPCKLLLMSVASLGLYQMYWLYENWRAMDRAKFKHVIPWLRTLVYPLFAYSNFSWVETIAGREGISTQLKPPLLFVLFFGLTFLSLDPWDLTSLLNCLPLLYANAIIIRIKRKTEPTFRPESKLTEADQWVIALGIAFYAVLFVAKRLAGSLAGMDLSVLPQQDRDLLSLLQRF